MAEDKYINAQAAVVVLMEAYYRATNEYFAYLQKNNKEDPTMEAVIDTFKKAKDLISALPTADVVEVRHGRWETVIGTRNSPKWGNNRVACSECRRSGYTRYAYCPHCGAKMDGKGEGE